MKTTLLLFSVAVLPKRESSRRKAKDNSSTKRMLQEKLLAGEGSNEEEEDLDLTDSDDDATWTPFKDKEREKAQSGGPISNTAAGNAHQTQAVKKRPYDEEELQVHLKKQKRLSGGQGSGVMSGQVTKLVPDSEDLKTGDFVVLTTDLDRENAPIWRLDSKTLLQRYNASSEPGGGYVHKSANLFTGFTTSNREKYSSVAVRFVNVETGGTTTVRVIQRGGRDNSANS